MAVLADLNIMLPNASNDVLNLYIRKATTLISIYLNVPIVVTPDEDLFIPKEPMETITFPDTPTSVKTDDGVNTTSQSTNIEDTYPDAIIEYVTTCVNRKGNEGFKQFSSGSRSATFDDGLSTDVKALLPVPFVTTLRTTPRYGRWY